MDNEHFRRGRFHALVPGVPECWAGHAVTNIMRRGPRLRLAPAGAGSRCPYKRSGGVGFGKPSTHLLIRNAVESGWPDPRVLDAIALDPSRADEGT